MKEESPRDYYCSIIKCSTLLQKYMLGTRASNASSKTKYPKIEVPRSFGFESGSVSYTHHVWYFCPFLLWGMKAILTCCHLRGCVWSHDRKGTRGPPERGELGVIRIIDHNNSLPKLEKTPGKSMAKPKLGVRRITLAHGISDISYLCPKEPIFLILSRICATNM